MICQLYDSWYRENCINMLSDQNTAMNWNLSLMTACIIVPECTIKVLKHWKLYKDAYILQESFATTDKSYPPPCRNYLLPRYLSVTLYACAQRKECTARKKQQLFNLNEIAYQHRSSEVKLVTELGDVDVDFYYILPLKILFNISDQVGHPFELPLGPCNPQKVHLKYKLLNYKHQHKIQDCRYHWFLFTLTLQIKPIR